MRSIVLDNEAVQALSDPVSAKHRAVVAHLAAVVARRRRGRVVDVVVPTAVRVEAGWDRTAPSAAAINRFRVGDHALDSPCANVAAQIQRATSAGVADAHLGATVRRLSSNEVVVLTSDPDDIAAVCSPAPVTIVNV
jgi:hypothetical protein